MIVRLKPALKSYLWGGTKLLTEYGKQSTEKTLSESWELSFHPDGFSIIDSGANAGKILADVATCVDWGNNCSDFDFFPVLIKLIDTADKLSVQVHPDDTYALANEHQYGKTEMWHILQCEQGAGIYLGFNRTLTAEQFATSIADNTILDYLNFQPVASGETYFIASGTVHAIGKGITLCEIQQNSSLTYRIYDFERVDKQGNKRELHIEKAKKVVNLQKTVVLPQKGSLLGKCKYFTAYVYSGEKEFCFIDSFCSITLTQGRATIGELNLSKGDTVFVSAGEKFRICGDACYVLAMIEK